MTTTVLTRSMIATYVEAAFDNPPVHREGLVQSAMDAQAPSVVLDMLNTLPLRHYGAMRELWSDVPSLPVE